MSDSEKAIKQGDFANLGLVSRFALQAQARELFPELPISYCLRRRVPGLTRVGVLSSVAHGRAHYKNLCRCGGVWVCAVCAAKITERRKVELQTALDNAQGYTFRLVTFTLQHSARDPLGQLLSDLLAAFSRASVKGEACKRWRKRSGVVGAIKSLEVTYGESGFHPHLHVLYVVRDGSKFDSKWLVDRWLASLSRLGRYARRDIGCDVRRADYTVAEYIAKYGEERQAVRFDKRKTSWTTGSEMTKGSSKVSRSKKGASMFQLLADSMNYKLPREVRSEAARLFGEFVEAFKGHYQLRWPNGLRRLLGLGVELTDQEVVIAPEDATSVLLGWLSADQWRVILSNDARAEVLGAASSGSVERVNEFLGSIGAGELALI